VEEVDARKWAHLGELLRERNRVKAAAEHFQLAWNRVKDRYESVSNKYALALLELKRYDEAEKVLRGSLAVHPGSGSTSVHLGRILLRQKEWEKARDAYLDALAVNPFDPEVYLALYRCYDALNDAPHKQRASQGLKILVPDFDLRQLDVFAKRLEKADDLSHVDWVESPAMPADAGR
jgi:predicted Zn-dependent protease